MVTAVLIVATLVFVRILLRLRVEDEVRRAVAIAVDARGVMRSQTLSDDDKQKAIQKAATASFISFLSLLMRTAVATLTATLVIVSGVVGKFYAPQDVIAAASDWAGVLALSLVALAAWLLWR